MHKESPNLGSDGLMVLDKERDEATVYKLVKQYLKKRQFSSIKEILNYLNNRLRKNSDFNYPKIERILMNLIKEKKIIPGTKLTRESILELPQRKEIYDYILLNPGTNFNELIKTLQLGQNHAIWHLKILEDFKFVRSRKINNQKVFFKVDSDLQYDKAYFFLKNSTVKKIVEFFRNNEEELKLTMISKTLKIHYNVLKKYINILIDLGLIIKDEYKKSFKLNHNAYYKLLEAIK